MLAVSDVVEKNVLDLVLDVVPCVVQLWRGSCSRELCSCYVLGCMGCCTLLVPHCTAKGNAKHPRALQQQQSIWSA